MKLNEEEKPELTSFQKKLINLIGKYQSGDIDAADIEQFIGSMDTFFNLINKHGVLNYIDPFNSDWLDYQNILFYQFIQLDPNYVYKIMEEELSDITEIEDKYYFDLEQAGDLSSFFSEGRNDMSKNAIESVLNGDHDLYFDTVTDNIYRDVYDELEKGYQQEIKNYLKEELLKLGELSIGYKTPELIEDLAKEQGDESKLKLDDNIVTQIIDDNDSLEYCLNNLGLELSQELYSLYSGCYESVYSNEIYEGIMGELVGEVIDNDKREDYKYKKHDYHRNTFSERWGVRFEVTNTAAHNVKLWIEENKNNEYETISYFGSYEQLLISLFRDGSLSYLSTPRFPDYPDFSDVRKCINTEFNSYF